MSQDKEEKGLCRFGQAAEKQSAERFYNSRTRRLTPYIPGEQPTDQGWIKLNTNENPYPPAPGVQAILNNYKTEQLRLYPDPQATRLRKVLAERLKLTPDQVFLGNGSDEVLAIAFSSFLKSLSEGGLPVLTPKLTYGFYPVYARLFDIPLQTVPLERQLTIQPERFCIKSGGVVIANPNAPTGQVLSLAQVEMIVRADRDRLVLVDEAYIDFGGESAVPLIDRYDNLLVVQTFSKSRSLAGARLGFALGHPDLIKGMLRVRDSFNSFTVDSLTQEIGLASLADESYFQTVCQRLIDTREKSLDILRQAGYDAPASSANFIWIRHPYLEGEAVASRMRAKGILVRHFPKPEIADRVRITVGCEEDMDRVCQNLLELL